ncbi:hypothetical protein C6Y62_11620 [Hyphomicrobium sulfonivorans]|nr:hypothetical protein [Hyphomicrobium sulfonivorans]
MDEPKTAFRFRVSGQIFNVLTRKREVWLDFRGGFAIFTHGSISIIEFDFISKGFGGEPGPFSFQFQCKLTNRFKASSAGSKPAAYNRCKTSKARCRCGQEQQAKAPFARMMHANPSTTACVRGIA